MKIFSKSLAAATLAACMGGLSLLAFSCSNNSNSPTIPVALTGNASLYSSTALLPSEAFSFAPNTVVKRVGIDDTEGYAFEWNEQPVVANGVEQQTTCKTFSFQIQRSYYYSDENGICGYAYTGNYKFTLDWSASNWENRLTLAAQKEKELAETDFTWHVGWVYDWGDVPRIIKTGSSYYLTWGNGSVSKLTGVAYGVTSTDSGTFRTDKKTFINYGGKLYNFVQMENAQQVLYQSEKPVLKNASSGTFVWTPYLTYSPNMTRITTWLFYSNGTYECINEHKPKTQSYKTYINSSSGTWSRNSNGQIIIDNNNISGLFVIVGEKLWWLDTSVTQEEGPTTPALKSALEQYRDQQRWYTPVVLP